MKKIKIIELLNKISKGEEVPKKIKYQNEEYYRNFATNEQIYYYLNTYNENLISNIDYSCELNDEVKIIEDTEEKKIEKLNYDIRWDNDITDKINELVDEVNELKEKLNEDN